jgi:hypothetical protein
LDKGLIFRIYKELQNFIFAGTGVWTRGLILVRQVLYHEPPHKPCFVLGIFEIGSRKPFAWAGFEEWSSGSLPPE